MSGAMACAGMGKGAVGSIGSQGEAVDGGPTEAVERDGLDRLVRVLWMRVACVERTELKAVRRAVVICVGVFGFANILASFRRRRATPRAAS